MKKLALLNYEGNIMECRIIKGSDLYLLVILLNDNGYINFIPTAKDMYSYLMGRCTVNEMIKGSKKIHVNNICKSPNEIDYKNIHSGEKRITDHSEEDLCIENISKIKEILEKTLLKSENSVTINKKGYRSNNRYNKYISPRNSNDSVPNEETILQIDSIVTSISKMDSLALYSCLDEDIEYMNMCMYRFLALLHKKFENFKTKGDTGLFITKGKCGGCFTGSEGIGFKITGNNTGDDWSLLFKIQKHHLIDIFECYNFKDAGPNNYKF